MIKIEYNYTITIYTSIILQYIILMSEHNSAVLEKSIKEGNEVLVKNIGELENSDIINLITYVIDSKCKKYTALKIEYDDPNCVRDLPKRLVKAYNAIVKTKLSDYMFRIGSVNLSRSKILAVHTTDYVKLLEFVCQKEEKCALGGSSIQCTLTGLDTLEAIYCTIASVLGAVSTVCTNPPISITDIKQNVDTNKKSFSFNCDDNLTRSSKSFVFSRPPHSKAHADHGEHNHFTNNAVIGAKKALEYDNINRVAIIDTGLFVGTGTRSICSAIDNIKLFSIYGGDKLDTLSVKPKCSEECVDMCFCKNYEADEYIINANTNEEYMKAFETMINEISKYNPDIIIVSYGTDSHEHDHIGSVIEHDIKGVLTYDDYDTIAQNIAHIANSCCEGRVVSIMDTGYNTAVLERCIGIYVSRMMLTIPRE